MDIPELSEEDWLQVVDLTNAMGEVCRGFPNQVVLCAMGCAAAASGLPRDSLGPALAVIGGAIIAMHRAQEMREAGIDLDDEEEIARQIARSMQ